MLSLEERLRILAEISDWLTTATDDLIANTPKIKERWHAVPVPDLDWAIEIIAARRRASDDKDNQASDLLFSRRMLEQSSRPAISRHHAARFDGCRHVLEIGTGLGSDCAEIAKRAGRVTSLEIDSQIAEMARYNLTLRGINNVEILVGPAEKTLASLRLSDFDGLWADPGRRDPKTGARIRDPQRYHPPLDALLDLNVRGRRGIKVSPIVNAARCAPGWRREFIGYRGECIEQTLWRETPLNDRTIYIADVDLTWPATDSAASEPSSFGLPLSRTPVFGSPSSATGVPQTISSDRSADAAGPADRSDLIGGFLIEPHAAVICAGNVAELHRSAGFTVLDPHNALGFSRDCPPNSALYERFKISDTFTFNIKTLRARLRDLNWSSRSEIKKRNIEVDPDGLRLELKLPAPTSTPASASGTLPFGVIFLTRINDRRLAILAQRERAT